VILPVGQINLRKPEAQRICKPLRRKILLFRFSENYVSLRLSRLDEEGRTRRHGREAGCDGRECIVRRAMRERTAKACGPGALAAGAKLVPLSTSALRADAPRCASDGDTKAGLTGARTI
jgi:hypothetical protein